MPLLFKVKPLPTLPMTTTPSPDPSDKLRALRPFLDFIPRELDFTNDILPSHSPLSFFSRDLDTGCTLQRIVVLPEIVPHLLQVAEESLSQVEESGLAAEHRFGNSPLRPEQQEPGSYYSAQELAGAYRDTVGLASSIVAFPFIHRWQNVWINPVRFRIQLENPEFSSTFLVTTDNFNAGTYSSDYYSDVVPENMQILKDMSKYAEGLIAFQFLAPCAASLQVLTGISKPIKSFPWLFHSTKGISQRPSTLNLRDAKGAQWENLIKKTCPPRRSGRIQSLRNYPSKPSPSVRIRPGKVVPPAPYQTEPRDFIQELWSHSVKGDTTWMVINCGSHELIGFRHRETQTLYVSQLIKVPGNAQYSKIHLGLHVSAMKDTVIRARMLKEASLEQISLQSPPGIPRKLRTRKRQREESGDIPPTIPSKRRKIPSAETVINEAHEPHPLQTCDWMLITSKYDKYNSPSPAYFIRCIPSTKGELRVSEIKSSYPLSGAVAIRLSPVLGSGATGQVHRGEAMVYGSSSRDDDLTLVDDKIIIKFAFTEKQQNRLLHEATIFQHFQGKNDVSSSVPRFFGCFRNVEGNAFALIMEYGGIPLGVKFRQTIRHKDGQEARTLSKIPKSIQVKMKDALLEVHNADILHRDIRRWNIVIDDEDNIKIIDFDRAIVRTSHSQKQREIERLESMLQDSYVEGAGYGSSWSSQPVVHYVGQSTEATPSPITFSRLK